MIKIFRDNGYNCFPISKDNEKEADYRYKASRTKLNQIIADDENYGFIAIKGMSTLTLDFDNKEKYREHVEKLIENKFIVVETGNGWHVPIKGINGKITKIELFDYSIQNNKIIEIQGSDHYCIGAGSVIQHKKLNRQVTYQNVGGDKIMDGNEIEFYTFIEEVCKKFKVTSKKSNLSSSTKHLRDQFIKEIPPTKGQSNLYFFEAARVCNTERLSQSEAEKRIKNVYDKWIKSDYYSDRPWENILYKINDVYSQNLKVATGRPQGEKNTTFNRTQTAQEIIETRKIYSSVSTETIYEDKGGFLEIINDTLQKELVTQFPEMSQADYREIKFKLISLGRDIHETDKNLVVFKNGIFDRTQRKLVKTDNLADMGFKEYDYLSSSPENIPHKFIEIMYGNASPKNKKRINAGLKSALSRYVDSRISIIYGMSGVGKSTGLQVLAMVLGEYALLVEYNQYLNDSFIRAKIENKSLVIFQDMPKIWKDFEKIKTVTGEHVKTERGFHRDSKEIKVKVKFWGSANYLPEIPEEEKNSMYSRRLSLIQNTRINPYPEDPELIELIVKEEGEKIISWILNIPDEACEYELPEEIQKNWEEIASPEVSYINQHYIPSNGSEAIINVVEIMKDIEKNKKIKIELKQLTKTLDSLGFIIRNNVITNAKLLTETVSRIV